MSRFTFRCLTCTTTRFVLLCNMHSIYGHIEKPTRSEKKKSLLESWRVALGFAVAFSSFSSSLRTDCDCYLRAIILVLLSLLVYLSRTNVISL